MRSVEEIQDEYRELRGRLDSVKQRVAPISDQGIRFQLTFEEELCDRVSHSDDEATEMIRLFRTPHNLMELAVFNETGGLAVDLAGNKIDEIPYPSDAVCVPSFTQLPNNGYLRERFFGVLHEGFEELEFELIKNRADLIRIINKGLGFFLRLQVMTFREWMDEAWVGNPGRERTHKIPLLDKDEDADFPEELDDISYRDLMSDPGLATQYWNRYLRHIHGGSSFSITLTARLTGFEIGDVLDGVIL